MDKIKTGVLLINLGTPDSPTVIAVARYLRQFLLDPRVIDMPFLVRWILVNCIILPTRTLQSTNNYKSIWTREGSPLLVHSQKFCAKLAIELGDNYQVALAMRYGKPTISHAIKSLYQAKCNQFIILPLFPHYASASTGSAITEVMRVLSTYNVIPSIKIITNFFDQEPYITALANKINKFIITNSDSDFVLFSYHSLPYKQIIQSGCAIQCKDQCENQIACPIPRIQANNQHCYRAQCYHTARLLAKKLNLSTEQWEVSFQSRLGKIPWIQPYTDQILYVLRKKGIKNLTVCCPTFVADCLETLEEIDIRAKRQWQLLGGTTLRLIPCLNDDDEWVKAVTTILTSFIIN